ncbi:hydroxypyruvate isomerase [Roseinatronobacter thiooxidans]|uniref:Hydroxypyruvate isomerase n=2 Tax=Roseinatronobacter thiooxidans TaxID=121821 RepID=A0A2W7RLW3_9RHOB|nr:hydroxypyruvate isomerase [Roseinatronobacter thiooxidans]
MQGYRATCDNIMKLSANLGFLFSDLPLAARIHAAHQAGFDAVEFHDQPQSTPQGPVLQALAQTGLGVIALNTHMGATLGRAALSQAEFAGDLDAAIAAATALGAGAIHITAGIGGQPEVYLAALTRALAQTQCPILIEPICPQAMPGYHLGSLAQAEAILAQLAHPRLKLMFDWYHIATMEGVAAALAHLERLAPYIGHMQLARIQDRGDPVPDQMPELPALLRCARDAGIRVVGLEYRPTLPAKTTVAQLRSLIAAL